MMTLRNFRKGSIAAVLALSMVLPLFTGCSLGGHSADNSTLPTDATAPSTQPQPTTPTDGDPENATCLGSYTVSDGDLTAAADTVVATVTVTRTETVAQEVAPEETSAPTQPSVPAESTAVTETVAETSTETTTEVTTEATTEATVEATGETAPPTEPVVEYVDITVTEEYTLTNRQLQVYYWMEVAKYREAGHETAPDFTQDLATQICGIDASVGSWQQYFLREALDSWASAQALVLWGQEEGIPLEEAYIIREDLHEKHLVNIPATDLLYGYNGTAYRPNTLHQAYLDNLPALAAELADAYGFASVDALAQDLSGNTATAEDLLSYAELTNRGYMFLTELGYYLEDATAEEVEAYFTQHEGEYAAQGITRSSGKYVDMRHILRIPENATVADDGIVTAEEIEWQRLNWNTQLLLNDIRSSYPYTEGIFATFASNKSMDATSALNGGLYENLVQGQMMPELDSWLFDDSREPGDISIIRTSMGMHIVYFSGSTEIWYAAAEKDLLEETYRQLMDRAKEAYPAQIDYSAIRLSATPRTSTSITPSDLLYADISHERYPEVPLYLQQDYQKTRYGAYSIVSHGCGITTIAMLASYMADEAYTPPVMCEKFGRYCSEHGTDRTLFVKETGDLGFYLKQQVFNSTTAYEALQQGYIVVNLQHEGYWTRGGHYLLLEELTEDGNVVVRDSNIYNYNKLEGHYVDNFEWKYIPGASQTFFIFHPKQTSHPQCDRCADGSAKASPVLINGDYQCGDCDTALARRNAFLNY